MSYKILIVDDSETTRMSIKKFLGGDYITREAENGMVALDILNEDDSFDLIILDINMPELDGMGFIHRQAEDEKVKKIPTIMCTTEASVMMKDKAKATGVVKAWLVKPVTSNVLLHAVGRVLGSSIEA